MLGFQDLGRAKSQGARSSPLARKRPCPDGLTVSKPFIGKAALYDSGAKPIRMSEGPMRVIVCGAGQVGSTIARHLATEGIDVTVVDMLAGAGPAGRRELRRPRDGRPCFPSRGPGTGWCARCRHADRSDPLRRGQHGGLPSGLLPFQCPPAHRPRPPSRLSGADLAGSLRLRPTAHRRDHLARGGGRQRHRTAAQDARRLRHGGRSPTVGCSCSASTATQADALWSGGG